MERDKLEITLGLSNRHILFRPGTSDQAVIDQIFAYHNYDLARLRRGQELFDIYDRLAASSRLPLVIDAGANIGASAIYFDYRFRDAHVIAIEPEQDNFDLLRANTCGTRVECIHAALTARPGFANVIDPGEGCWGYRTTASDSTANMEQLVECVTINELYESHSESCAPFIVKIDIEGGESDLFSANTEWVAQTPLIIIELHDWLLVGEANSRAFLRCISEQDRDFVYVGENIYSIDNKI